MKILVNIRLSDPDGVFTVIKVSTSVSEFRDYLEERLKSYSKERVDDALIKDDYEIVISDQRDTILDYWTKDYGPKLETYRDFIGLYDHFLLRYSRAIREINRETFFPSPELYSDVIDDDAIPRLYRLTDGQTIYPMDELCDRTKDWPTAKIISELLWSQHFNREDPYFRITYDDHLVTVSAEMIATSIRLNHKILWDECLKAYLERKTDNA